MKKMLMAVVLFSPIALLAQNAFDGTWRVDLQSGQISRTNQYLLQNGVYHCESCVPKIEVQADGQDHSVSGSPYADTLNVKVVNDRTVEFVSKKGGKVVGTRKETVSEDGDTLTNEWSFETGGSPGSGKTISARSGTAPAGANKISGSWKVQKDESASDSILTVTFKSTGDGLSMSDPLGDSYTAKFDGKDYPYKGDPGITTVALTKVDANTIVETDKRDGKVIYVTEMKVSPDGKTMAINSEDKLRGANEKHTAKKQ
jgi:hypothetical protein